MVYYVTHPNLSVTALIDAPSTEKARTTFLDYLERRNLISRTDRQYWRRNMVAERMTDAADVQADVELHYGYQEGGNTMPPSMAAVPSGMADFREFEGPASSDMRALEDPEGYVEEVLEAPERPTTIREVFKESPGKLSPIQQVSLGEVVR